MYVTCSLISNFARIFLMRHKLSIHVSMMICVCLRVTPNCELQYDDNTTHKCTHGTTIYPSQKPSRSQFPSQTTSFIFTIFFSFRYLQVIYTFWNPSLTDWCIQWHSVLSYKKRMTGYRALIQWMTEGYKMASMIHVTRNFWDSSCRYSQYTVGQRNRRF